MVSCEVTARGRRGDEAAVGATRLGIVQLSRDRAVEYGVHERLVGDGRRVEASILQQPGGADGGVGSGGEGEGPPRRTFVDVGRDYGIEPQPSRRRRAALMARRAPLGAVRTLRWARRARPTALYCAQRTIDVYVAWALARLVGAPLIVHLHYPMGPWLPGPVRRAIRGSDRVVAVSDFVRRGAIADGVDPGSISIVPNPGAPVEPDRSGDVRRALGLDEGARVVIAAGRLDPGKGLDVLIDAFAELGERHRDAVLVVCGRTSRRDDYADRLVRRARATPVADRIVFAGHRDDLDDLLASSDVFCLPTVDEAFGLVFVEAMGHGLPVVACDSGGVPEIVRAGVDGLLVPPGDASAIAGALDRLLDDDELRASLGEAGRERARTAFDPEVIADRWVDVVRSVPPRRRGRAPRRRVPRAARP